MNNELKVDTDKNIWSNITQPNAKLYISNKTFKQGTKLHAVDITTKDIENCSRQFKFGYVLWGADIWINKVPLIKILVLINIINMILVWIIK